MGPNVVGNLYCELLKYYTHVHITPRNEPFFTHQILCHDADGTLQALIRYGWSDKSEKWVFECLASNDSPLEYPTNKPQIKSSN
jgi:hypothetical protein